MLLRVMANSIPKVERSGNACLDVEVDPYVDGVKDEDDVEATPKEIHDLLDIHE